MPNYNSFSDFARQQLQNFRDVTQANKVLREAVVTAVPQMKQRIQNMGKNSKGGQIGTYGSKKIKGAFDKARAFGSKKRLKKVTGEEGYKELRQKLGLQVEFVDLTFSGDMMRDFVAGPTGPNSYGLGFRSNQQRDIANKNEKRYGPVFDQTDTEEKLTLSIINDRATKLLSR